MCVCIDMGVGVLLKLCLHRKYLFLLGLCLSLEERRADGVTGWSSDHPVTTVCCCVQGIRTYYKQVVQL